MQAWIDPLPLTSSVSSHGIAVVQYIMWPIVHVYPSSEGTLPSYLNENNTWLPHRYCPWLKMGRGEGTNKQTKQNKLKNKNFRNIWLNFDNSDQFPQCLQCNSHSNPGTSRFGCRQISMMHCDFMKVGFVDRWCFLFWIPRIGRNTCCYVASTLYTRQNSYSFSLLL